MSNCQWGVTLANLSRIRRENLGVYTVFYFLTLINFYNRKPLCILIMSLIYIEQRCGSWSAVGLRSEKGCCARTSGTAFMRTVAYIKRIARSRHAIQQQTESILPIRRFYRTENTGYHVTLVSHKLWQSSTLVSEKSDKWQRGSLLTESFQSIIRINKLLSLRKRDNYIDYLM